MRFKPCLALFALLAACGGASAATEASAPADVSAVAAADPGSRLPEGWDRGTWMQVYVRGYQDSDGDGIGDLRGLISRLDYLQQLGIAGLWLMPVTASGDHDHGYAVTDYRAIEPQYGSLADFDALVAAAHARGIGIVIDYVINHSAATHPLFAASRAADSPYRDWYIWQPKAPGGWMIYGNNPWHTTPAGAYFAGFWSEMPDFNLRNPRVLAWHEDNLRFWLNRGVDGFRFDAVGNLIENGPLAWEIQPENDAVMLRMQRVIKGYANRWLVCEGPGDPQNYALPAACGSSFAFGYQNNMVSAAAGVPSAISRTASYFNTAPPGMVSFLGNHDSFAGNRVWNRVRGDVQQYRLAAAINILQANRPFVYYGEEIGMAAAGAVNGDPALRTPMSWTADARGAGFTTGKPFRALSANVETHNVAAEQADPDSLLNFYKAMIALRKSRPSLQRGEYRGESAGMLMQFRRTLADEQTLVVFNFGGSEDRAEIAGLAPNAALSRLWPRGDAALTADGGGKARLAVPARSFVVYGVTAAVPASAAAPQR